jgi:hypothetical protein
VTKFNVSLGLDMEQAYKCGGDKPVDEISTILSLFPQH